MSYLPHFIAFDALTIDGRDIRGEPLWRRKRQLRRIIPRGESRLLFLDHLQERGQALFEAVCAHDCEGIAVTPPPRGIRSSGRHGFLRDTRTQSDRR
jgi:ATP-dependent DNA ligase